jgi:hypothetical protein
VMPRHRLKPILTRAWWTRQADSDEIWCYEGEFWVLAK